MTHDEKKRRSGAQSEKTAEDRSLPGRYGEIHDKVQRNLKRFRQTRKTKNGRGQNGDNSSRAG
jgi:hypothetical protein